MVAYVIVWPQVRSALTSVPMLGRVLDLVFGFAAILLGIAGVAFTLYTVSGFGSANPPPTPTLPAD